MASNKIHLGNTKIVSDSEAPEDTIITTPTKSGTMALLSDLGGGGSSIDAYTRDEIDTQQAAQDAKINKNASDIAALEAEGSTPGDVYTKEEIDDQQDLQDIEIAENATNITNNAIAIAKNAEDIAKNTKDISEIPAPIDTYNKAEIDSQQKAQDDVTAIKADKVDVYTKVEINAQQSEQDAEIAKKADKKDTLEEAPEDGETYARNNKTWVSISETSGIPDAPVDGKMYGRKDGEWDAVADAGDIYTKTETNALLDDKADSATTYSKTDVNTLLDDKADKGDSYTKAEIDIQQSAQDTAIQANKDAIEAIPAPIDTYTKTQIDSQQADQDTKIDKNADDIQTNADAIDTKANKVDVYTKAEVDDSQNEQDTEITKKADKTNVYTKTEIDTQQSAQDTKIDKNTTDVAKNTSDITKYTADIAQNTADIAQNTSDIAQNTADIDAMPPYVDAYTKTETNTLLDAKANADDSYLKAETYNTTEIDGKLFEKADKTDTYTKDEVDAIAGSGGSESSGIEEAPADGKQYARQDEAWTEVEASGGGEAQPPVLFDVWKKEDQNIPNGKWEKITFDEVETDTNSFFSDSKFQPTIEGWYQINFRGRANNTSGQHTQVAGALYKNGLLHKYANSNRYEGSADIGVNGSSMVHFNGTTDYVEFFMFVGHDGIAVIQGSAPFNTWMNGNMISSITEGEVKEKEAVVFSGKLSEAQDIPKDSYTKINIDTSEFDTNNALTDGKFKPNVAGYYQVNANVHYTGSSTSANTMAVLYKNGIQHLRGSSNIINSPSSAHISTVSDVIYLDGVDDYVELWTYVRADSAKVSGYTRLSAHLITGQSSGGSGGSGGGTTDILPVLYSGVIKSDGTVQEGTGFTSVKNGTGDYTVTLDKPISDTNAINATLASSEGTVGYVILSPTEIGFFIQGKGYVGPDDRKDGRFSFTVTGTETIAVGGSGGGGGGDYTPEPMVWQDVKAERELDVEYTNTQDVPLYVQIYTFANGSGKNAQMWIDGKYFGATGNTSGDTQQVNTNFYVIPSNSTYELKSGTNSPELKEWHEARMPVAVGTGGKTVAFRGELSVDQAVESGNWTKVELDTASVDTDNAFADGKFQPSVSGYYQVSTAVSRGSGTGSTGITSAIYKNGSVLSYGSNVDVVTPAQSSRSVSSDIVYLNGTTDYIELWTKVIYSSGGNILGKESHTFLSAVLVSGGSASGDSIWTEEDGNAVYDGDIEVNGDVEAAGGLKVSSKSNNAIQLETGRNDHMLRTGNQRKLRFRGIKTNSTEIACLNEAEDGLGKLELSVADLVFNTGGNEAMIIGSNGQVYIYTNLTFPNVPTGHTASPNTYLDVNGTICKTSWAGYSIQEVDKKLAIKDKLIEKLSARLDKLEKRLKK